MPTWKLTLEYDGTRYRGWQSQKNTDRTVQGALLRAAHELLGADATLGGAGRTDAGVHALAQVAHLKAQKALPETEIAWGLNERLPADINVTLVEKASAAFPRAARARQPHVPLPHLAPPNRVRQAAWSGGSRTGWTSPRCAARRSSSKAATILRRSARTRRARSRRSSSSRSATSLEADQEIHFRITASHFLWKMVRRLAGTLVEVGRGNLDTAGVEKLLREKSGDAREVDGAAFGAVPGTRPLLSPRPPGESREMAGSSRRPAARPPPYRGSRGEP